jgi:hypothetical protein
MNDNESLTENSTDQENSKPGRSISISVKILAVTLGTTIIVLTVSGIVSFMMSRNAIEDKLFDQLTSVREIKGQQIENYVDSINRQIITSSESLVIVEAMYKFRAAFDLIGKQAENHELHDQTMQSNLLAYYRDEYFGRLRPNTHNQLAGESPSDFMPTNPGGAHLQGLFISDNPHPTGMKQKLDSVDNSLYSRVHEKFHPSIPQHTQFSGKVWLLRYFLDRPRNRAHRLLGFQGGRFCNILDDRSVPGDQFCQGFQVGKPGER